MKKCIVANGPWKGIRGQALINSRGEIKFFPDSGNPHRILLDAHEVNWNPPKTGPIKLEIPFELGQKVWVYFNNKKCETIQVPVGYDHMGTIYRLELKYTDNWEIKSYNFHFGLLDRFSINEIYASESECRLRANSAF